MLDRVLEGRGLKADTAIRPDATIRLRHQCEIAKIALLERRQATNSEWKPPASQEQQEEFLYYEPCVFCKRRSLCCCISDA